MKNIKELLKKEIKETREKFEANSAAGDSSPVFAEVTTKNKEYNIMAMLKEGSEVTPDIIVFEGEEQKVVYTTSKYFPLGSTEDTIFEFI